MAEHNQSRNEQPQVDAPYLLNVRRSARRTSVVCFYGDGSIVASLRPDHYRALQRYLKPATSDAEISRRSVNWFIRHLPALLVVRRRGAGVARA